MFALTDLLGGVNLLVTAAACTHDTRARRTHAADGPMRRAAASAATPPMMLMRPTPTACARHFSKKRGLPKSKRPKRGANRGDPVAAAAKAAAKAAASTGAGAMKRRGERVDSVNDAILTERDRHVARIEAHDDASTYEYELLLTARLRKLGLGKRKSGANAKRLQANQVGACGASLYLGSSTGEGRAGGWPTFKHMLPEVALVGHSNCGKSTLVNSLVGVDARKGPARVSERAGWTDAIYWYQLGKKPPKLTLVDAPGYGHAVAQRAQVDHWTKTTRSFLVDRPVLSRTCVLVDATRGLCDEDVAWIQFLEDCQLPHQVVLTKGDLLPTDYLARCVTLVGDDLRKAIKINTAAKRLAVARGNERPGGGAGADGGSGSGGGGGGGGDGALLDADALSELGVTLPPASGSVVRTGEIAVVSGHTGAGVQSLWRSLMACARATSKQASGGPAQEDAVRIHVAAGS